MTLSNEEKAIIANEMSSIVKALENVKEEKKQAMKEFSNSIKELEEKLLKLSISYSRTYATTDDIQLVLELKN